MSTINALVSWPSAPLTDSLVRRALAAISLPVAFISQEQLESSPTPLLQWSTYDQIDHELVHFRRDIVLSSSFIFRKALIRKHYLSRIIQSYTKKYPHSALCQAFPRTFEIELSFADELDEMWTDELWELGEDLVSGHSWWILKPGMADRGMGIRIFNSKEDLQQIFLDFENDDLEDVSETQEGPDTSVVTSQLRHFVIQEYIDTPLLLDPGETLGKRPNGDGLSGRKFHLRVYCVAKGDMQLFVYKRILALFSSVPYLALSSQGEEPSNIDLKAHLTNTSLQAELGDSNVRLLDELQGCRILSDETGRTLTSSEIDELAAEISTVLAEVFRAAAQNPVHFQPLPNAFELYGVDFLVCHTSGDAGKRFCTKILELNAEPAIELTGPRLTWILEDLFESIAKVCVEPFFSDGKNTQPWVIGEVKYNFLKCVDENIRSPGT